MYFLRWALIFPAAIAGWYGGVAVGLLIHQLGEWSCPAAYVVSDACAAPWSGVVMELAVALGSAVAGCLIVLLPSAVAPARGSATGLAAFLIGVVLAVHFVLATRAWLPFACAVAAGCVTMWVVTRRFGPVFDRPR